MPQFAQRRFDELEVAPRGDAWWVFDARRQVGHSLGPVTAAVWSAADGTRDVAALVEVARAVDPTADAALVWQVLDSLADVALLEARVAPAGPVVDRRAFIGGLGTTALLAVGFIARPAEAKKVAKPAKAKAGRGREERRKHVRPKARAASSAPGQTPGRAPAEAQAREAAKAPVQKKRAEAKRKVRSEAQTKAR